MLPDAKFSRLASDGAYFANGSIWMKPLQKWLYPNVYISSTFLNMIIVVWIMLMTNWEKNYQTIAQQQRLQSDSFEATKRATTDAAMKLSVTWLLRVCIKYLVFSMVWWSCFYFFFLTNSSFPGWTLTNIIGGLHSLFSPGEAVLAVTMGPFYYGFTMSMITSVTLKMNDKHNFTTRSWWISWWLREITTESNFKLLKSCT